MRWVLASLLIVASQSRSIPSVFQPMLPKLRTSAIPVYLPTWIPRIPGGAYPIASVTNTQDPMNGPTHQYSATLSNARQACEACVLFQITGSTGFIALSQRGYPIRLRNHHWGYVTGYQRTSMFEWFIGPYVYSLGCGCTAAQFARIANSVVRVA